MKNFKKIFTIFCFFGLVTLLLVGCKFFINDSYSITINIDGKMITVVSNKSLPLIQVLPSEINEQTTYGFYLDESMTIPVDIYSAASKDLTLYTQKATLDKLSFSFDIDGNCQVVAHDTSISGKVVIPKKYQDSLVKVIGESAFFGCKNITEVVFPESIEIIGQNAFLNCSGITDLKFSNSITTIGDFAFSGCTNLENINIRKGLTNLGNYAFYQCSTNLKNISSDNAKFVSVNNCLINLESKSLILGCANSEIPTENVVCIEQNAFDNCQGLTSIFIPKNITQIKAQAFWKCTNLSSVTIESKVIGNQAFGVCEKLKNVNLTESVEVLGQGVFYNCKSLQSIIIPNKVTTISANLFDNCIALNNISLPNSIKVIQTYAFSNCTSLTQIAIPSNVVSIQSCAFLGCNNLNSVIFIDISCWQVNSNKIQDKDLNIASQAANFLTNLYCYFEWSKTI